MNKLLFSPFLFALASCNVFALNPAVSEAPDNQKLFLSEAIVQTPYSALVKHTQVDVEEHDEFMSRHVYYADVIETVRGNIRKRIKYSMLVERDEEPVLDTSPAIVTLCFYNGAYYWPGTGAQFDGEPELIRFAKAEAEKADAKQSEFAQCD
ncbi:hypothetical protein [Litoribacillus peritrichatus]|uniref:DUF4136 domain-containing protein n=1 Tax=Litoribacillus peritrichatus TaxID=718191 RepID=A0ABP7M6K7_9GAMM